MPEYYPLARSAGLVVHEVDGEVLSYDVATHRANCLNETSAFVWRHANGRRSLRDIESEFTLAFGVAAARDTVAYALNELERNDLMSSRKTAAHPAVSRRVLLRRIGVGAAVAIPVVALLVAPPATHAASCSCVNPGACLVQVACPSTVNCNGAGVCAP